MFNKVDAGNYHQYLFNIPTTSRVLVLGKSGKKVATDLIYEDVSVTYIASGCAYRSVVGAVMDADVILNYTKVDVSHLINPTHVKSTADIISMHHVGFDVNSFRELPVYKGIINDEPLIKISE